MKIHFSFNVKQFYKTAFYKIKIKFKYIYIYYISIEYIHI